MDCFPLKKSKKELLEDEELFDFSYYKIERSKTLDSDYGKVKSSTVTPRPFQPIMPAKQTSHEDVAHKKKFANIFAWLEEQEHAAAQADSCAGQQSVSCPCCHDLHDSHYACSDVTRPSKLITFSPHRRNFESDVKYARTSSFSHSRSNSLLQQQSHHQSTEPLAITSHKEAARQRTMSLNTQYRYQAMNQQSRSSLQKIPQQTEEYYYSTPNSRYEYSHPGSSIRSANSRTGLLTEQKPTRNTNYHQVSSRNTSRRPSTNLDNSDNSDSQHSRTGSLDSTGNTEYIYLDFHGSSQSGGTGSYGAGLNSSWQVTRKPVESPLRKNYV